MTVGVPRNKIVVDSAFLTGSTSSLLAESRVIGMSRRYRTLKESKYAAAFLWVDAVVCTDET